MEAKLHKQYEHKISNVLHSETEKFSFWQRATLRRFHPQAIVLDSIAAMWSVYFLWNQNWMAALGIIILSRAIGTILALKMNYFKFSQLTLGKIALLHLNPVNITVQSLGLIPFVYGLWVHSTLFILGGVSLVILGHILGWSKVLHMNLG